MRSRAAPRPGPRSEPILGSLLFVVFPIGVIGGAIVGALVGRAVSPGLDGAFVKGVEDGLAAGGSALFLLVKPGSDHGLVIASMRQYKGTVLQTSLDDEEEAALRHSLE